MIATLRRLAGRLDAEWRAKGFRTSAFPGLAARSLSDFMPSRGDHLSALAEWILTRRTFPVACNPFGQFGPPAFTVWSNGRFFVNLYAYTTPEVVVHDHNFAGAFVNVAGRTLHCTYAFTHADRIDASVRFGEVALDDFEMIDEGAVRRIEPGSGFIHQVWHLSRPTIVLVIRTPPLPRRATPQFQYLRPAIATEVFRDRSLAVQAPERFQYTTKMSECLRGSAGVDMTQYVMRLVEKERPWDAVWHLVENWRFLDASGALQDAIRRGAKQHGTWFAAMEKAGGKANLFNAIDWHRVLKEQDRIVLALLLTFDSWPRIAGVLQRVLPDVSATDVVLETLQRLAGNRIIPLMLSDEHLVILSCALRSEGSPKEWRRSVRESFEIAGRSDWTAVRDTERFLHRQELLRPLFTFDGR